MTLTVLFLYALLIIAVGMRRSGSDADGFFFASRHLGPLWIGATLTASWIGAASTLVTMKQAREAGYAALWVMAIPTLLTLLVFFLIAGRIRRIRFTTLPELVRRTYGTRVAGAAAGLIFVYMILLTASQFIAWGQLLGSGFSIPYAAAVWIGGALVFTYSVSGGFVSVVRTDLMQLVLLTIALGLIFLFSTAESSAPVTPALSQFLSGAADNLLLVFSFTLAWVISPVVWQRIVAAESRRSARLGILFAAVAVWILYLMVIPAGMNLGTCAAPDAELLSCLMHSLPSWAGGVIFLGFGSAILSTADTGLNLAAMTLSLDFTAKRFSHSLRAARWSTLIAGGLAILAALRLRSILQTLGTASEIMASGLFVPGMAALILKTPAPRAGACSLAAGGGFALLSSMNAFGLPLSLPHWPQSLPWGLALSLAGFFCGYALDRRPRPGAGGPECSSRHFEQGLSRNGADGCSDKACDRSSLKA